MRVITEKILVTGAAGQIGTELTAALRSQYGAEAVIATDLGAAHPVLQEQGPYYPLNVLHKEELEAIVSAHGITQIYHLAAMLSASGEKNPLGAWDLNMQSLLHVLEAAKKGNLRVFWPSSIAVFGPNAPKDNCPQHTITEPATIYGISKLAGEQWCQYYYKQYGVDVRSIRYPGLISYTAMPGGGTTDYAVDIYHQALKNGNYTCYLHAKTALPMMYMPDAIRATIELMLAPAAHLKVRTAYNLSGISFTPAEIARDIQRSMPGFNIGYRPDFRQQIADGWPASIDDREARADWGWYPEYDLASMTTDMLKQLQYKYQHASLTTL